MEHKFMAVIDEAARVNRLEMTRRYHVTVSCFDRNRLYPMEGILKDKKRAQLDNQFMREE